MTASTISFEFPQAFVCGIPVAFALLAWAAWQQRPFRSNPGGRLPSRDGSDGHFWPRVAVLTSLRFVLMAAIIFLLARPIQISKEPLAATSRAVTVLLDRSESMALEDADATRYQRALGFLRDQLLPALKSARLPVQAMTFAETGESADGEKLVGTAPNGKRTNLGGGIAQAFAVGAQPPLAVITLTDGAVNENADNNRALALLVESGVPFIGVGFGSDRGARTLALRHIYAPPVVATRTGFSISAQLESMNAEELPQFDLLLFRDGALLQKKTVASGKGSRQWLEHFQVVEDKEGAHTFTVQMIPPQLAELKCPNATLNAAVRVSNEHEVRVLYIQGAMTWDYKFISLAMRSDPAFKITGLTRTSKQSIFRQNVESAGELLHGFPAALEELAPFRVVVLSNLKPADLTTEQQDVLARFCGELGGGLLMIGGPATFDSSWQRSRLEQMLPVVVSSSPGVLGFDRPFRIELTEESLQHPVFQLSDTGRTRELWAQLPTFSQYGRVDAAKPGAQVWLRHQTDEGPKGRRILMASERYGAGLSAVLCIQNFWRWRLARDSDPQLFDRFWRQLFRFLSDVSRQDIVIHLADQELHPEMDVQIILEKQPNPSAAKDASAQFSVRVEDSHKKTLREQRVDLQTGHPVDFKFRAGAADTYTVSVLDPQKAVVASRAIEIREVNLEFQDTARNMETLRQWAAASGGLALKVEDCRDAGEISRQIQNKVEDVRRRRESRRPFGINAWMLTLVLGCLGSEWVLRKRWRLA